MVGMLIRRFKEPSSYAGFSAIALTFGMSSELYNQIAIALAGICGVISMIMKDPGNPEEK
ncbi:MAG: hypothetical protein GOVbin707_38 [Prokaryotic dsDNA virus sp.]|nr:MAG: hypothetical protein GOVbin707_38 [Prokaryotic dsDNA virus sp.]|tara:strand:- start:10314 stop:10493 length:180 start_codon:yes stop_codon:yes gene_type:complete